MGMQLEGTQTIVQVAIEHLEDRQYVTFPL
jgi:hypothetical protein